MKFLDPYQVDTPCCFRISQKLHAARRCQQGAPTQSLRLEFPLFGLPLGLDSPFKSNWRVDQINVTPTSIDNYDLAINFQNKVIEAWEDHGPSAEDELEEAQRLLEELKNKAREEMAKSLLKAMPVGANDGSVLYEDSQIRVPVIENKAREQISNSLLKALPRSPNDASVPDEDFQVRVSSH
ncbi:hypothetical protein Leryth_003943 [Lithospermum erythrorhizon]|nr:hypothetical protein Leryth_003943 [Lithospermum erythrorhizon]